MNKFTKAYKPRQKMQNITIAIPEQYVQCLLKIQDIGMIPSRSEGIRQAIKTFIKKEIINVKKIDEFIEECKNKENE